MAEARQTTLHELRGRLINLNENFASAKGEFQAILSQLDSYLRLGPDEDLFDWLEDLLVQENILIVHGFLAVLYLKYGPDEASRPHFDQAKEFFPDNKFWQDAMINLVYEGFEDLQNRRPT